ncbi:hypothetical protein [Arthrobacter sp. RAF14]|uniref:hypothetical protein n=1 Tax=Arthrobacter sp. RAF14 TaxID=3233051 RepID=UPI003F8F32C5
MTGQDPRSWLDRLVGACVFVFVGAVALWCSVQVLQSVLPFIVLTVGVIALLWAGWAIFRYFRDRF